MMDPSFARCLYCGNSVDPLARRNTYHRVVGWERKGQNGGSDIACREPRDEYACVPCITRLQQGIHAAQGSLL